jgi:hypothetical protein
MKKESLIEFLDQYAPPLPKAKSSSTGKKTEKKVTKPKEKCN